MFDLRTNGEAVTLRAMPMDFKEITVIDRQDIPVLYWIFAEAYPPLLKSVRLEAEGEGGDY